VKVPNFDWIAADREGITINDATSAVFAQAIDWSKCDVTTFSWQKVLGGEGAHGMLILSPRAIARLESYTPDRPLPKIFRLTKKGKVDLEIFEGSTINTPSLLATEDYIDALKWAESLGGLEALQARANANAKVLADWAAKTDWVDFLAADPATRSNTSVCLKVVDPRVTALSEEAQAEFAKKLAALLEKEGVAPRWAPIARRLRACASGAAARSKRPTSQRSRRGSNGRSQRSSLSFPLKPLHTEHRHAARNQR
jgi:phosphoserine aminotransferase